MSKIKWEFTVFYVMTFVLTILIAVGQQQAAISFDTITLPQLAPSIAAFLTMLFFASSKTFFNFGLEKSSLLKFLIALILPILVFSIGFYLCIAFGLNTSLTEGLRESLPLSLIGMFIGAVGEEIGWRGFLQPNLEKKYSTTLSSIITGLMWGFWHIGHYQNGVLFMIGFLLFTVSASIIIRQLVEKTNNNLFIAALFHFSINIAFVSFFKNSLTDANMMLINGVLWTLFAMITLFAKCKNTTT
jgi:uncharacterized protein